MCIEELEPLGVNTSMGSRRCWRQRRGPPVQRDLCSCRARRKHFERHVGLAMPWRSARRPRRAWFDTRPGTSRRSRNSRSFWPSSNKTTARIRGQSRLDREVVLGLGAVLGLLR